MPCITGRLCSIFKAQYMGIVFHIRTMDKTGSRIGNTGEPKYYWQDKAGGYGIQDPFGMRYIKRIVGDYYNVVGLPVSRLLRELNKLGIDL